MYSTYAGMKRAYNYTLKTLDVFDNIKVTTSTRDLVTQMMSDKSIEERREALCPRGCFTKSATKK